MPATLMTDMRARGRLAPGLHRDGKVTGLWLNVGRRGNKSWVLRYTPPGAEVRAAGLTAGRRKPRAMGLGPFPAVSVAAARERAEEARQLLAEGLDPLDERRRRREEERLASMRAITFAEAAYAYIDAKVEPGEGGFRNAKHRQQWRNTLETYAVPLIGAINVTDVDTDHVLQVLLQETVAGPETGPFWTLKTETATRVRGRIEKVLAWAAFRGLRPKSDNPARWHGHLEHALVAPATLRKTKNHAAMPYAEIPGFMANLRKRSGIASRALEFAVLTAARSGEVRNAVWAEMDVNGHVWTIPAERMKAGRQHEVPLTDATLAILAGLPRTDGNEHVFAGSARAGRLSENALLSVLKRMGLGHLTQHGFRSTFRDWAGETTSHPREIMEYALAHGLKDRTEAAYQRGTLFPKRKVLMAEWSDYCGSGETPP